MRTAILFILCSLPLFALDDPRLGGPRTYATPSPNGQFLFVMIAPRPTNPHPKLVPEQEPHEKAIYEKYSATGSGLYRNDGSTNTLFNVDWYSYLIFPADDGQHVVRYHGDSSLTEKFPAGLRLSETEVQKQASEPTLSFYERDKLLKTYAVKDLVKNIESLPHSLQHILWSAGGTMTADGKQFSQMTQDSRQFFFDLASGDIAYERDAGLGNARVWVVRISLALVGLAALAILIGFAWHGRLTTKLPNAVP